MRHPRLKPAYRDTWHHCYNRAVGTAADRPFNDADKEQFVRILMRVAAFYDVRIVAYQVQFCSYGVWSQTGRHPFAAALRNCLIPALPSPLQTLGPKELRRELRQSFARVAAEETQAGEDEAANSVAAADREPTFTLSARRHVRHYTNSLSPYTSSPYTSSAPFRASRRASP